MKVILAALAFLALVGCTSVPLPAHGGGGPPHGGGGGAHDGHSSSSGGGDGGGRDGSR
jgi:hypothetical protein